MHGGLRYLASGQLGIAHESAAERHLLLTRIAPHLTRSLAQVRAALRAGSPRRAARSSARATASATACVDSSARRTPCWTRHGRSARAETLRLAPAVRAGRTCAAGCAAGTGSSSTTRGSSSPSRARRPGTGHPSSPASRPSHATGDGARLRDTLTGDEIDVSARAVISATGVWAGDLDPDVRLRPSRGTHLVVDSRPVRRIGRVADGPGARLAQPLRLHAARAARTHVRRAHRRARRRSDPRRAAGDRGRDRHASRRRRHRAGRAAHPRRRDRRPSRACGRC